MANEGHVTLCGPLAKPAAADDDCCREPLAPAAKRARVVLPAAIPYGRNGFRVRPDRTIVPTDLAYAEVYSERRARRTDFGSRCVTVLRSACDTGKTHITLEEIRDAVAADRIPYVVWIVTRIALAANICKRGTDVIRGIPANVRMEDGETETSTSFRMREARRRDDLDRFAFANYRERDAKALARSTRTIVCTLQSLPKLENSDFMKFVAECECEGKRGWLVCDESEEIGKTFSDNETMDGSKLSRAFAVLKRTARASSVILMDAWPAESTATLAACFSDRDEDVHCIYNAWRMESRSLYRSETLGQLFETMLCDLRGRQKIAKQATPLRGPKIALISTTKAYAEYFAALFEALEIKIKLYTGDTSQDEKQKLTEVEALWRDGDFDVLIYTPTIAQGVDFSPQDVFFRCYAIATDTACTARHFVQMLYRVRNPMNASIVAYTECRNAQDPNANPLDVLPEMLRREIVAKYSREGAARKINENRTVFGENLTRDGAELRALDALSTLEQKATWFNFWAALDRELREPGFAQVGADTCAKFGKTQEERVLHSRRMMHAAKRIVAERKMPDRNDSHARVLLGRLKDLVDMAQIPSVLRWPLRRAWMFDKDFRRHFEFLCAAKDTAARDFASDFALDRSTPYVEQCSREKHAAILGLLNVLGASLPEFSHKSPPSPFSCAIKITQELEDNVGAHLDASRALVYDDKEFRTAERNLKKSSKGTHLHRHYPRISEAVRLLRYYVGFKIRDDGRPYVPRVCTDVVLAKTVDDPGQLYADAYGPEPPTEEQMARRKEEKEKNRKKYKRQRALEKRQRDYVARFTHPMPKPTVGDILHMLLEKADKKIKLHPCLRRLRDETREQHDTRTLDAAKDGTLYDKLLVESLGVEHEAYEVKIEAERKKKLHKMHSITEFIRPGAYAILRGTTRAMDEAAAEAESNPPRPVHAGPPTAADELIRPVRKRTRVGMTAAQKETIGKWIAVHGNNPSPHDYDEINALPGMDSVGRPKLRKYFDNKRNRKQ